MKTRNKSGKRWTEEEDEFILDNEGLEYKKIAELLGRSKNSVAMRKHLLRNGKVKKVYKNQCTEPADYSGIDQDKVKRLAEMYGQPNEIERVLPIDLRFEVGDSCNLVQQQKTEHGERIKGKVIAEYETFYLIDTGNYKTTVYKWGSGFRSEKGA